MKVHPVIKYAGSSDADLYSLYGRAEDKNADLNR